MSKVKEFEDLRVWQEARQLVKNIYLDFGAHTPGHTDYGFRDQFQRAGLSIMNNVAEGFERSTDVEFARFLDIAKGSCGEVRSMYYCAEDLGYIAADVAQQRREKAKAISKGMATLSAYLRRK